MAWKPISGTAPQYEINGVAAVDHYLKFYAAGTTTPINMATDSTGGTMLAKSQLDANGFPLNGSAAIFIPHIPQKYKIVLYANATDADANTFGNALFNIDGLSLEDHLNIANYELGSQAAAAKHTGVSTGFVIKTDYLDTNRTFGSVASFAFNGTTTVGKAGNWPDTDGFFYDDDGKKFQNILDQYNIKQFGALLNGSTDDSGAINISITAMNAFGGGTVLIPPSVTTCRVSTTIAPKANVTLAGGGWGSIIEALTALGNNSVIDINAVNNFHIRDLKIDGNGGNGTTGGLSSAAFGIRFTGAANNVTLDNIWLFDCYYVAIAIRGGSDINISNIKVDTSGVSTGILIGGWSGDSATVRGVNLNNILVEDQLENGIFIWAAGSGTTENINLNNVTIRDSRTLEGAASGHALGGSTGSNRVNITNLVIEDVGETGNGIHLEAVERWTISNAVIRNDGIGAGVAINVSGAAVKCLFDTIVVENWVTRGLLTATTTTDCRFNNISIANSSQAMLVTGGNRNKFSDIALVDDTFGGSDDALRIIGAVTASSFDNIDIRATGAPTGNGISIDGGSIVDIEMHGTTITGFGSGKPIRITNAADFNKIRGEQVSVRLQEAVAAGDDYEVPILAAIGGVNMFITGCSVSFDSDITQNGTDLNTYTLTRRDSAGDNAAGIWTADTNTSDFNDHAIVPFVLAGSGADNARVSTGENVSMAKVKSNSGQAETNGVVVLQYVTY